MKKIRLGILGAGKIVGRIMEDMHRLENVEITAIAARDLERAKAAAQKYNIKYAFGSYLELAKCDEVDLVYIATTHTFHKEQSILMMEHGKNVICEKPMAINCDEVKEMIACARKNDVFFMEAMWTRFLPCMEKIVSLIKDGVIGEVGNIFGQFSWYAENYNPQERNFNPELAGGALLDLGVYPLMISMQILGSEPKNVQSLCRISKEGVDMHTSVQMQYENGAISQFFCGMDTSGDDYMEIYGSKGYIKVPGCWHPRKFVLCVGGEEKEFVFNEVTEAYHYEFDHAAKCIMEGLKESPIMPLDESLKSSEICTKIRYEHNILYPTERI